MGFIGCLVGDLFCFDGLGKKCIFGSNTSKTLFILDGYIYMIYRSFMAAGDKLWARFKIGLKISKSFPELK